MAGIQVDESRFPLVVVTFVGQLADHEFDRYLLTMSRVLQRRTKNALVFDALRAAAPTAMQRSKQAAWLKANRDLIVQYSCGSAFVIASAIIRGGLTAILWVSPIPGAHTVVSTLAEGEAWAFGRLAAEGVSLSAGKGAGKA
jgi:hypothetical protein